MGLIALLALAAAAQKSDEGQIIKFSSSTNLVIVDVTVKDKAGQPIEGLKQEDFAVFEDGKPQKLAVFEFQKLSNDPEPPAPLSLGDQVALPEAAKNTITIEKPGQVQYHD